MASRIVVTGASGFVGRHLCQALIQRRYRVVALCRRREPGLAAMNVEIRQVSDLAAADSIGLGLQQDDTIVHLAGRAHVLRDSGTPSDDLYFHNNLLATRVLVEEAVRCGASRVIFLSTAKVFGDGPFTVPLTPLMRPLPTDAYGSSKLHAEDWLLALDKGSSPDCVIVRPPLIYGPGVRANFLQLLRLVERGIPLPFGGIDNLRSFVSVWNLCDLIMRLIQKRDAAGEILHVSDMEDCSTPQIIREIAAAMGKKARLFDLPQWLVGAAMTMAGRSAQYGRLAGSLQLDVSRTVALLDWRAPVARREGLERTVAWYSAASPA